MNWLFARKLCFSEAQFTGLPQLLEQLRVDRVLLGGDFTSTALPSEFETAQQFVQQLHCPWTAVPGNHDVYTLGSHWTNRYRKYFGACPSVQKLNDEWTLITLNTARPSWSSKGHFSEHDERALEQMLRSVPSTQKIILLNHYSFLNNDRPTRSLVRAQALEGIVAKDHRIKLYLHGHTHRHTIADLQYAGLPIVLDGGCSADTRRGSWNLITLGNTCQIDVYKWTNGWNLERTENIPWKR